MPARICGLFLARKISFGQRGVSFFFDLPYLVNHKRKNTELNIVISCVPTNNQMVDADAAKKAKGFLDVISLAKTSSGTGEDQD